MVTNEKVLAMYQAVWSLLEEGADIYKLKVADITARAGIGKGTAYEYFRSKEELLERALEYQFYTNYETLKRDVEQQTSLKAAVDSGFAWLEGEGDNKQFAIQFFKMIRELENLRDFDESMDCMKKRMDCGVELFRELLAYMVQLGKSEGTIRREVPEKLAALEILSRFLGYFMFLQMGEPQGQQEIQDTKSFMYENLVKSLGKGENTNDKKI